ncbi:DUF4920 domain-containing protein [Arcticibacter sp. MXS-1]|uniref:DUF4920 domain-containing protein n=1 Tax=Arcticibacter sp. MXS-1 TaxID=3341726 RepID=UPI0035A929D6
MRTLLITLSLCAAVTAGKAQNEITPAAPGVTYGKTITATDAASLGKVESQLKSDSVYTGKIEGTVTEVCKKKGCFMKLARNGSEPVMVRFKDYGFFMPQNIVGKTVVLEGKARVKETSVERLQHFAKDAGKSDAEIAKIKEPRKDIEIIADGVIVKN